MKALLRYIDALPVEITLSRYYRLEDRPRGVPRPSDLTREEAWNTLRTEEGNFLIPDTRERWQHMCETPIVHDSASGDLPVRASSVLDLIREHGLGTQLYSLGVGLAALEYHIKRLCPALQVFCSDYSDVTVARLKLVFHECDAITRFDLTTQSFRAVYPNPHPGALVLIHRVDPHLTDDQWRTVFHHLGESDIGHVLFVPYRLLTLRHLLGFKRREYRERIAGAELALAGYVRTRRRWARIWEDSLDLVLEPKIGYSQGFLLKPKR